MSDLLDFLPPIDRDFHIKRYRRGQGPLRHSSDALEALMDIKAVRQLRDVPLLTKTSRSQRGKGGRAGEKEGDQHFLPLSSVGRQNLEDLRRLVDELERAAEEDLSCRRSDFTGRNVPDKNRVFTVVTQLKTFAREQAAEATEQRRLAKELTPEIEEESRRLTQLNQKAASEQTMDEGPTPKVVDEVEQEELEHQERKRLREAKTAMKAKIAELSKRLSNHNNARKDVRFLEKEARRSISRVLRGMLGSCGGKDGNTVRRIIRELLEIDVPANECVNHISEACEKTILTEPWMSNALVSITALKLRIEKLERRLLRQKRKAANAVHEERQRLLMRSTEPSRESFDAIKRSINRSSSSSVITTSMEDWRRTTYRLVNDIRPSSLIDGLRLSYHAVTNNADDPPSASPSWASTLAVSTEFLSETKDDESVQIPMSKFMGDARVTEDRLVEMRDTLEEIFQQIEDVMRLRIEFYQYSHDENALQRSEDALTWLVGSTRSRRVVMMLQGAPLKFRLSQSPSVKIRDRLERYQSRLWFGYQSMQSIQSRYDGDVLVP